MPHCGGGHAGTQTPVHTRCLSGSHGRAATDLEGFDAIIVGAGQAGPAIAARCSREGLKTAVIKRYHFGGTCVFVGCVPTKTLVASARAIQLAQRGAEFGFDVADLRVDIARVMARKNAIVAKSREGVES